MKNSLKYFGLFFILTIISAGALRADNDSTWIKANEAYSISEYTTALENYHAIENSGYESWKLFYNIGNSYFKLGEVGKAILYYEKAVKLNPANKDVQTNLKLSRLKAIDKIDAVPEFVLSTFVKNFRNILSSNGWGWFAILFLCITVVLFLVYKFIAGSRMRKTAFSFAVLSLLLCIVSFCFSVNLRSKALSYNYAIVINPLCNIKSAPNSNGNNLFVLHEGTKIEILEQTGGWSKIELADGRQGWAVQKDYEII